MVHWGMYTVGGGNETWVIDPDMITPSGNMRRHIIKKEKFHLWDCPSELYMKMNKEQVGYLWKDLF